MLLQMSPSDQSCHGEFPRCYTDHPNYFHLSQVHCSSEHWTSVSGNIHLSCYSSFLEGFFYFFPFSFLNKGHELPMGLWERELSRTEISWKREQISSLKETEIISPGKDFSGSFFPCWKQTTFTECLLPLDVSAGQKKGKSSETTYSRVLGYGYHSSSQNNAPGLLFAKGMNNNWHSWECFIGQLHTQMCGDPNLWSTLP